MARSLGTLTVDLLMKTGQFETDTGRAARIAERRAKEIKASFDRAGAAIGVALAGAATATAYAIKSAIDRADELSKAGQKIGVSTEALSALEYAARLSDVSLQQLSTGIGKLSQNMVAAVSGNKQLSGAFDAIGVSVTDANGKLRGADEVLLDLADVFKSLPDGADQTALAMQLMGKSGRDMVPLLNGGSEAITAMTDEARTLGLVVGAEFGKQAEEFNDALTTARAGLEGAASTVATQLTPTLLEAARTINDPQFREGFAAIIEGAANATIAVAGLVSEIGNLARFAGEDLAARINGTSPDDVARLRTEYEGLFAELQRLNEVEQADAFGSGVSSEYKQGIVDRMAAIQELIKQQIILNDLGRDSAETPTGSDEADISALEVKTAKTEDLTASLREYYKQLSDGAANEKAATDALKKQEDALNDQRAEWDRAIAAHADFVSATEDLRAELAGPMAVAQLNYQRAIDAVNESLRAGDITTQEATERQELLAESLKRTTDEIESQRGPVDQMLEGLRFEASLIGLTNDQREKEIALRQLGADATAEQRAEVVALLEALQNEYNQGGAIAQMFEESLSNVKDGIADSIEDAIFDGADAGFDSARDVFERFARDIASKQIIMPILAKVSGGGMSGVGGILGALGIGQSIGGNAGSLGSLLGYGFASTGVGAGLIGGGLSSLGLGASLGSVVPVVGTLIGGLLGSLFSSSKPPDIRLGGATGNVRKPEGSTTTAFGELIYGARGLEGGEADFIEAIKDFDAILYDLIESTSTGADQIDAVSAALSGWELELKGSDVTAENILGDRFDAILGTFDASIQEYVNAGTTLEDRIARFEEAVLRPDRLNDLMEGIATAANMAALSPFEQQMQEIATQFDAVRDAAIELGASQEQLAEIEGYRAEAIERLRAASAADYAALVADLDSQLAELTGGSEFQRSLVEIAQQYNNNVEALNAAARAAGMASAREEDLARALQLSTLQRARAVAALQAEGQSLAQSLGYTALSGVEAQIAALEQEESAATAAIQSFGDAMGEAASNATDAINLLLGDLSPYKDRDKLQMALDAQQQGLIGPEEVLRIAQRLFASGTDYNQVFAQVMAIGDRRSSGQSFGGSFGGTAEQTVSPEMQALLAERDALLAEQEAAQRKIQAGGLAQIIADIAGAQGISFEEAAAQLGIADIASLAADLGIDRKALNDYLLALQADSYSITDIAGTITAGEQGIIDALFELFGEESDGSGLRSNLDPDAVTPISADEPLPIDPDPIVDPIIDGGDSMIESMDKNSEALEAKIETLTATIAELLAQIAGNTAALPSIASVTAANQAVTEASAPRSKRTLAW